MPENHNFYFHVPFCASKCRYCAFYSHADISPNWDKYCDGILRELDFWYEKLGKISVPTIFWGGGTPSLMPVSIFEKIMNSVRDKFNLDADCEITLESNPGTIDKIKLGEFQKIGVNRLSIGVQSLSDEILQFLGRTHNVKQSIDLLDAARELGLKVSADFMYGLPGQNANDIKNMCDQINKLNLNHISMYELTVESNTPFGKMNLQMPDNDEMAKMYETISETLTLPRYEVSNYATPGFECKHNLNIWNGQPYIGFGRGAAGRPFINDEWYEQSVLADTNYSPPEEESTSPACRWGVLLNKLSNKTRAIEKIMTGMRTIRGVKLTPDINDQINWEFVNQNPDLIQLKNDRIFATEKGILILDNLMLDFIK